MARLPKTISSEQQNPVAARKTRTPVREAVPQNTRSRILQYLREQHTATTVDLANACKLTRADIRYHLAALVDEALVEPIPRDPSRAAPRGRPAPAYRLTTHSLPGNLPTLCDILLSTYLAGSVQPAGADRLAILADALACGYQPATNQTRRMSQAIDFLNQAHYRARWEAGALGPRVILRHCPYAVILPHHPELCQLDRLLLEKLIQASLYQTTRQNLQTGSPPACIFVSGGS